MRKTRENFRLVCSKSLKNFTFLIRVRLMTEERNIDQREGVRRRNVCRRLFQDDEGNGENDNLVNRLFEEARRNQENVRNRNKCFLFVFQFR